mgnify:CR=1 FL=1
MTANLITTAIIPLVSIFLGFFLFYQEKKRGLELKNRKIEMEMAMQLVEELKKDKIELKKDMDKKDILVSSLYSQLDKFRDTNNLLTSRCSVLNVIKCQKIDCDLRIPPLVHKLEEERGENEE